MAERFTTVQRSLGQQQYVRQNRSGRIAEQWLLANDYACFQIAFEMRRVTQMIRSERDGPVLKTFTTAYARAKRWDVVESGQADRRAGEGAHG